MAEEFCPHPDCGVSLQGAPIPAHFIERGYYPDGATHYSRKIGVEVRGEYDGVLFYKCPDCGFAWVRNFGDWQRLDLKSLRFVLEHNEQRREEREAA